MGGKQVGLDAALGGHVPPAVVVYHEELRVVDPQVGIGPANILTREGVEGDILRAPVFVVEAANDNRRVRADDDQHALKLGPVVVAAALG